jgi:hypothetical protein
MRVGMLEVRDGTPSAVGAYGRMGFAAESDMIERNGLRFVPMRRPAGAGPGADVP